MKQIKSIFYRDGNMNNFNISHFSFLIEGNLNQIDLDIVPFYLVSYCCGSKPWKWIIDQKKLIVQTIFFIS